VRALPKRGAPVLVELPWPARLALTGEERGWSAVRLEDGRDGFVPTREVAAGRAPGGDPTGARLVKTARALVGAPYLWGGRSAWGFDCSGLVQSVFAWHGLVLPRDSQKQWERGGGRGRPKSRPGDLLFFGPDERRITHVALATGSDGFLHAYGEVRPGSLRHGSQVYVDELVTSFLGAIAWGRYRPSKGPPAE
jgi:cell wall-associated NlpC family hydrolase